MQADRLLPEPEVIKRTSLSHSTLWRKEQAGEFPGRRQISANRIGWLESEIQSWIEGRAAK